MLRSKIHIRRKGAIFSVLVAIFLLGIGAVVAFNSEQFNFANLFNLGAHQVEYKEDFVSPPDWRPCDVTPKTVITTNKSNTPIKVRLQYDEFWRNKTDTGNLPLEDNGIPLAIINFQNEADWTLQGGWYYYNYDLEPGQSTSSLFESVALNCEANFGSLNTCTETETGTVCTEVENPYEDAKYHLSITVQTSSGDFSHEGEHYAVTIDPNGGKYNDSTEIYTTQVDYGTVIDLSSATYVGYDLENWTLNNSETYTDSSITVTSDINLKANWVSSTWYTVTINPNGGTFENHTEAYDTPVRQGGNFVLSETEPTREGYLFEGWFINDNTSLENHTFAVTDDVTITAKWGQITAQNNRTNKLYSSLTSAESEAQSGDTITLLRNAEETFVNGKDITLDLGDHVLSGSITNNGTMTLLNGEVNNSDGAAFVNNGSLTMGVNDYIDENTVNIESTAIRLVGTTTGLKQNGTFNYYDGFIEGDIALEGGYNDSPFYRNTFDDEEVHFFPFVDKSPDDDTKQRVILESSDLAVSKTKVGGDIYYYSLQDNINTSIRTGYKIYIAREDWSTGEPITVPEGADVTIDLEGHTFTATDTITVNGKLTIEDSQTTIETVDAFDNSTAMPSISGNVFVTPHDDNTTTTVTYAGNIWTPQTTIINGELVVKNAKITGSTANDAIQNNGSLTMQGGAIGAGSGYTMRPIADTIHALDKNSYLYSLSTSKAAVYTATNFAWDTPGNIYSNYYGIHGYSTNSNSYAVITVSDGTVYGKTMGINAQSSYSKITINGGTVKSSYIGTYGTLVFNSGNIIVSSSNSSDAYGIASRIATMNGGTVVVANSNGSAYGIGGYSGHYDYGGTRVINGGTIIVTGSNTSYGVHAYGTDSSMCTRCYAHTTVNDGSIVATSTNQQGYGVYSNGGSGNTTTISGGTIEGRANSGTSYGAYLQSSATITGGIIKGGTYGIYGNENYTINIGENDEDISTENPEIIGGDIALYNGYFNFYDGILRGGTKAYQNGSIRAIPDATTYHIEQSADYDENCWLTNAAEYLMVNGVRYNSLQKAYDAITGDSGTIKVVENVTVEAVLPEGPTGKNITFDLNGHELTYTQSLVNNGTMVITDSDPDKAGRFHCANTAGYLITNNGTLTVESGYLSGAYGVINSSKGTSITINGGTLDGVAYGIYAAGSSGSTNGHPNSTEINIAGGLIKNNGTWNKAVYGIYGTSNDSVTVNMTGGKIALERTVSSSYGTYGIYGCNTIINVPDDQVPTIYVNGINGTIYGASGNTTLTSGKIEVVSRYTSSSYDYVTFGIYGTATVNSGVIDVTTTGSASVPVYGLGGGARQNVTVNGGSITVNNTDGSETFGIGNLGHNCNYGGTRTINGGSITVTSKGAAYGVEGHGWDGSCGDLKVTMNINAGTILAMSTGNTSYGVYARGANKKDETNIRSGSIEARSDNGVSYGAILYGNSTITGGTVKGGTYGIYGNENYTTNIGVNDENISTENPEIIGGSYALYNGYFNFYDGILRGGTKAYQAGNISTIADNSAPYFGQQTIDNTDYSIFYLTPEHNTATIGSAYYTTLANAIENAQPGETIDLIGDGFLPAQSISTEKNFTIQTNGHKIYLGGPITNNGKLSIIGLSANHTALEYNSSKYIITNNAGAELSLNNIDLLGIYDIENKGTLTLNNSSLSASNTALNNTGIASASNSNLSGGTYSLYSGGGESSLSNSIISGNSIYNAADSTVTLLHSTATKSGEMANYVTNNGNLVLDDSEITLTNSGLRSTSDVYYYRTVYNKGLLTASNGSTIKHVINYPQERTYHNIVSVYNDGGEINAHNLNIVANGTNTQINHRIAYGIYSPTGTVTIRSGDILATNIGTTYGSSYGIYTNTGTIIIGTPEPTTSTNYGKDTADVSPNNPNITAIGASTGIGVKNNSGGRVEYYDGKVSGNTAAFAEEPTVTEHFYEPCTELDTTVTPNLYTTHLFWMRDGQSSCANN